MDENGEPIDNEQMMEKIANLLNTAKAEYKSALERLMKLRWSPFDAIASFDRNSCHMQEARGEGGRPAGAGYLS